MKASSATWWRQPWVILWFCFAIPPLGIFLMLQSSRFRIWTRALLVAVLVGLGGLVFHYKESIQEGISFIWYNKFRQSIRKFEYRQASEFLKKVHFHEELDQMEMEETWVNHHWSLGEEEEASQKLESLVARGLKLFDELLKELPESWSEGQEEAFEKYLSQGDFDPLPLRGEESAKLVLFEKKLLRKADRIVIFLQGSPGVSSLEAPLIYMIFTSAQPHKARQILKALVYLHRILPDRYSPFDLDFCLLAYHIQYSSSETLKDFEDNYHQDLLQSLSEYVDQSPYNLKARYLRGIYHRRNGDLKSAREDWLKVFKLDVRFMRVYELLRENVENDEFLALKLYRESEDYRFFEADFPESIRRSRLLLAGDSAIHQVLRDEVLFNLGVIYRNNIKDYKEATACFEKILSFEESIRHEEALYNLVMCSLFQKDLKESERRMKELVQRFPQTKHRTKLRMLFVFLKTLQVLDLARESLKESSPKEEG